MTITRFLHQGDLHDQLLVCLLIKARKEAAQLRVDSLHSHSLYVRTLSLHSERASYKDVNVNRPQPHTPTPRILSAAFPQASKLMPV